MMDSFITIPGCSLRFAEVPGLVHLGSPLAELGPPHQHFTWCHLENAEQA